MLRETIIDQINSVATQQARMIAPLTDDLVLLNSGLDSLCFAILVARLEEKLGIDPFSREGEIEYPITLGDFIRFYDSPAP